MFLRPAPETPETTRYLETDLPDPGYIMNCTRLWAWRVDFAEAFGELRAGLTSRSTLRKREFAVLVCAAASALRDSYCSLAWGRRLAAASDDDTAAAVLRQETPSTLTQREAALAQWARKFLRDPNSTTAVDVERLRAAGLDDKEIFEATAFVALRAAFSTVNDALGALPDAEVEEQAPAAVRAAVGFGRPVQARAKASVA